MRVVIDISADDFNSIRHGALFCIQHDRLDEVVTHAFNSATIIPKGSGDLIDRSKLDTRERGNNSQRCMWWNIKQIIENAPVVIEADKENENDKSSNRDT